MGAEPSLRTIDTPWSGVLLEGMRRIDESTAGWRPEWDERLDPEPTEQQESVEGRIVKAIGGITGVESALLLTQDGTLIAQDKSVEPEREIKWGVHLREEGEIIGSYLDAGNLERIVLTAASGRIYLQQKDDKVLLLNLPRRSSAESIFGSVETIFKRYQ